MHTTRLARDGGQTLAEFALVVPLFLLLVFGIIDFSRGLQSYVTIQEGARDGARYAVTGRDDCSGASPETRPNCIAQAVKVRTQGLGNTSNITVSTRSWAYPAYSDPPTENDPGQQCDAVEVEVHYDYTPITPVFKFFVSHIPMTAKERLVNEPYGTCS